MRRRHTREEYLDLVAQIRESIPGVTLSTDVIVGFPGETTADFDDTLSLTEAAQYHSMFSFKYSPRPNTLASKRMPDDVSAEDKTARIIALQGLQRSIQTRLHQQAIGTEVDVLVDSASRRRAHELSGRTSGNTVVDLAMPSDTSSIATDWIGRTVTVRVTRAGPHNLSGDAVSWAAQARRTGSC
jgi:tRNA-2-methylthio-N6-dimethylallyladenosine synthase